MALLQAKGKKSINIQDCRQVGFSTLHPKRESPSWNVIFSGSSFSEEWPRAQMPPVTYESDAPCYT